MDDILKKVPLLPGDAVEVIISPEVYLISRNRG